MSDKPVTEEQGAIKQETHAPLSNKSEAEQSQAAKEFSQAKTDGKLNMTVKVHSPFRNYFEGPAFSVSAVNNTGPFDILPKHHNFISLLGGGDLVIRSVGGGDQKIRISGGIMHVKADRVTVFLDV